MAESPEEVLVDIEAQDNATPSLTSVGRSISVMGSTLGILTRDLGIHNAALDAVVKGVQELGAVVRFAGAAQRLMALATDYLTASQVVNNVATDTEIAQALAYIGAAEAETAANYGLAASFAAVNAAMGPIGWALLAAGVIGAGVVGFAAAGGFTPTTSAPGETTQIYMANVNMRTQQEAKTQAEELATYYHHAKRRYGR